MTAFNLRLAGTTIKVEGDATARLLPLIEGMQVFAEAGEHYDVALLTDQAMHLPSCQWCYEFDFLEAQCHCRFGRAADGCYYFAYTPDEFLRYNPHEPSCLQCGTLLSPTRLRFLLWMAVALIGCRHRFTLIHSSTVVAHGRAVLFLGESGTGKSTHTRLWLQHISSAHLLNDDSPILRCGDGGVVEAYGSPWSGKTPCYCNEHYPVAAIVRLEQRKENIIRRLPPVEAFAALQPSCPPAFAHDEALIEHVVGMLSQVVKHVPVYRLGCRPDEAAAWLSHNTIFPDA